MTLVCLPMISLINDSGLFAWISLINDSGLFAWISLINDSGLFAWISLTASSLTYFIFAICSQFSTISTLNIFIHAATLYIHFFPIP